MVNCLIKFLTLCFLINLYICMNYAADSHETCDQDHDAKLSVQKDEQVISPDIHEFCDDDYTPSTDKDKVVKFGEFKQLLKKDNVYVIDVREPEELEGDGAIPNTFNIPLGEVESAFSLSPTEFKEKYHFDISQPESVQLIFTCRSGCRSEEALEKVLSLGFKHARHFGGGFLDWEEKIGAES